MKETASLTLKLFLICSIVVALLAFVNMITAPIIENNDETNFQLAMSEVLPDSNSFEQVDIKGFAPKETGVKIGSLYKGNNGGYVSSAICSEGYGGDISVMVGINDDFTINKVKIMAMAETPGLGAKASEDEFINQYNGLTKDITVTKDGIKHHNLIYPISGATRTSNAVTKAVNAAIYAAEYSNALKIGGEDK